MNLRTLRAVEVQLAPAVRVLDRPELAAPSEVAGDEAVHECQVQRGTEAGHVPVQCAFRSHLTATAAASRRQLLEGLAPGLEWQGRELGQFGRRQLRVVQDVVLEPRIGIVGCPVGLVRAQVLDVPRARLLDGGTALVPPRPRCSNQVCAALDAASNRW